MLFARSQAIDIIFMKGTGQSSAKLYVDTINMLLHTYAPLKRINKYKLKLKSKPWITLGLLLLSCLGPDIPVPSLSKAPS